MPAEAVHLTALRESMALPAASGELRALVARNEDAARLGSVLIDFPYFHRFKEQVVRYALGLEQRHSPWGAALHADGPVAAIAALLRRARAARDEGVAALAIGLASHAALDRMIHPLVNALARENGMRRGLSRMSAHMEVEKYQSICFHEVVFGEDAMGTPRLAAYIALGLAPALEGHPLGAAWREALDGTCPTAAAAPVALGSWGRGYRSYTALLGSPLGKTLAPEKKKAWARPLYLSGPWGDFADLIAQAIAGSVPVLERALAAFTATDADADAGLAAFLELLPPGTIDGDGAAVDLAEPYRVELRTEPAASHAPMSSSSGRRRPPVVA
jgi:hypothetical protein